MSAIIFKNDDVAYQGWIKHHDNGYVINTTKNMPTNYMTLHKATCHKICQYNKMARPGGFTERKYIKICGNSISELQVWLKNNGRENGTFSGKCSRCNP